MIRKGRAAITELLRDRIVSGLHTSRLQAGDRLPGIRALAAEFEVNERVVLAALRTLGDEGFVVLRPRTGAFVGAIHPTGGSTLPSLSVWLVETLIQARARGLAPRDLPEHLRRSLSSRRVRAACIECNGDQLHLLCSELAGDHGFATRSIEVSQLEDPSRQTALRRADLLVTTMYHAAEVQRVARRLKKACIAVVLRPEVMTEVTRALATGPLYYVATDARYERKLRRMLGREARQENLHVMLVDRDDLTTIPDDAPCFVMTSARAAVEAIFGRGKGPGQPMQPPRSFSDDSARELLAFLVQSNLEAATQRAGTGEVQRREV